MVDRFNNWLIKKYLNSCGSLDEFDKERIAYSMNILLNEFEKIVLIMLLFASVGKLELFIFSFIVLMSLRIFIGGIHFSTRCGCFIFTSIFFITVMVLSNYVIIGTCIIKLIIFGVAIMSIVLFAPLPSKHRMLVLEGRKYRLKRYSVFVMIIWAMLSLLVMRKLANVVIWTVIMQQLEILYYEIFIRRKETKKHED